MSEQQCPVCCESLKSPGMAIGVTTCGHCFHQKCYDAWSNFSNNARLFPNSSSHSIHHNPLIADAARRTKCPSCNMRVKKFVPIYLNLDCGGDRKPIISAGDTNTDVTQTLTKDNDNETERSKLKEEIQTHKIIAAVNSKKCMTTLEENKLLRSKLARAKVSSTEHLIALNRNELLRKNLLRWKETQDIRMKVLRKEIQECRIKLVTQKVEYVVPSSTEKIDTLLRHCRQQVDNNNISTIILIFAPKTPYDLIFNGMHQTGISNVSAIHQNQNKRENATNIQRFRTGQSSILITTDVTAAAVPDLDVMGITKVINLDMPDTIVEYRHRCAFARSTGSVISLISEGDVGIIRDLRHCLTDNNQDVPEWFNQMYLQNSNGQLKDYGTAGHGNGDEDDDNRFSSSSSPGIVDSRNSHPVGCNAFAAYDTSTTSMGQPHGHDRQGGTGLTAANTKNYETILEAMGPYADAKQREGGQIPFSSSADHDLPYNTSNEELARYIHGVGDGGTIPDSFCDYLKRVGMENNVIAADDCAFDHLKHNSDDDSDDDDEKSSAAHDSVGAESFYDDEDYCYYSDGSM